MYVLLSMALGTSPSHWDSNTLPIFKCYRQSIYICDRTTESTHVVHYNMNFQRE